MTDFILGGSKITADGDCSHEIKRCLLLGRKVMTNLDSILPTKVRLVKAMVFPVVMYGCESWTVKKAEHQRQGDSIWKNNPSEMEALTSNCFVFWVCLVFPHSCFQAQAAATLFCPPAPACLPHHPSTQNPAMAQISHIVVC